MGVRSHRDDFAFERRLYAIALDKGGGRSLRLGPSGVPVRGLVYFVAAAATVFVLVRVPLVGVPVGLLPPLVAYLAVPAIVAMLLTYVRPGGRVFHVAVRALAGHLCTPRHLHAFSRCRPLGHTWRPAPLLMLVSGAEPGCRRLRFTGPGLVWIGRPHAQQLTGAARRRPGRGVDAHLTETARTAATGTGRRLAVKPGRTIQTRPPRTSGRGS